MAFWGGVLLGVFFQNIYGMSFGQKAAKIIRSNFLKIPNTSVSKDGMYSKMLDLSTVLFDCFT